MTEKLLTGTLTQTVARLENAVHYLLSPRNLEPVVQSIVNLTTLLTSICYVYADQIHLFFVGKM